jgi:hypothetical protein
MDVARFDRLTRALTEAGTRRGMLGLLATLPVLGSLFALLDRDDVDAQGRRKRRKKRHKHGKGRRRKHHKHCKAKSKAETCAGKCGQVTNNCKKTVDCGSCSCDSSKCANGCCDARGQCQVDNNLFCGTGGVACSAACPTSQVCSGGVCTDCSTACGGCEYCAREATGGWFCATDALALYCDLVCTTTSDCGAGFVCAEGVTVTADNSFDSFAEACGRPGGAAACTLFTAC